MGKYRDNAGHEDEFTEQTGPRAEDRAEDRAEELHLAEESSGAEDLAEDPGSGFAMSGDVQDAGPERAIAQISAGSKEPNSDDLPEVRLRKCRDHPKRFPDEDPMRPLTEFPANGRYPRSYCRRCQVLRQRDYMQARREQHKVPSAPTPDESNPETAEDDETDSSD